MTDIREDFEKAYEAAFHLKEGFDKPSNLGVALWAAQWAMEKCASIANHKMGTKDPAYAVACSDLKIMFREMSKELSNDR